MNFLVGLGSGTSMGAFYQSLEIMGFGMVGIFIVLGMIFVAVKLLIKVFPERENL